MRLAYLYHRRAFEQHQPVAIADARADVQLADELPTADDGAAAYLVLPLRTPQRSVFGSLCVIDRRPRHWSSGQMKMLQDFATAIEPQIVALRSQAVKLRLAAHFQSILADARDPYISVDDQARVTMWNEAAETMFGHSTSKALGKPFAVLIAPTELQPGFFADVIRAATQGPDSARLKRILVDSAGQEFPAEVTVQTTSDLGVTHFHLFVREETFVAPGCHAPKQQGPGPERGFLQALLDTLDTGVVACDSAGRLNLFNRAARYIHGVDATSLDSDHWPETFNLYAEDGYTLLTPGEVPLARAFTGEVVRGQSLVVRRPGRMPRRFVANAEPIDSSDGQRLGAVVAMHDLTERHHAELLNQAQLAVTRTLADATSAEEATAGAVTAITRTLGWIAGQYWHVDESQDHISVQSTHCLPNAVFPPDVAQTLATQVWRRDTELWTGSAGAGACLGVPVRSESRVLGVMAFATGGHALYDEGTAAMLNTSCAHLGRFVSRRHTEDLTLALSAVRRDFDRVIDRVNDYVWTVEVLADGVVRSVFASPDGSGVFGAPLPTGADMAAELAARIHPDDLLGFAAFHAAVSAGRPAEIECRVHGYDEVIRWVWTRASPRREGSRLFADGISTNITDRHRLAEQQNAAAQQAHQAEQLLTAIVAVSHRVRSGDDARATIVSAVRHLAEADSVALLEPDSAQPPPHMSITAALGTIPTGTCIAPQHSDLITETRRTASAAFVTDTQADPRVPAQVRELVKSGSSLWQPIVADGNVIAVLAAFWQHKSDPVAGHEARAVALLAEETALALVHERLLKRLEHLAHTDALTGLSNRRAWHTELPRLLARARRTAEPLTVALLDLDHFKRYNDVYGHPAGDELLRSSATAFNTILRDGDLLVRWGGEEFAIALVDCEGDAAAAVLDRLRAATPDGQTCSAGYATWDGAEDTDRLLSRVDAALYAAKGAGRNTTRQATAPEPV
ncbi:diguanylate cyclase (GGDEF)-like protein/PAS domain S-box-containing protein [Actinoplanes couchii]|uniref:Diguanylate cyclase with PAS/PAC and GAF sensors n=2 Tax=Actinoplanes couchii TaxID=403638 RepID=A0ABQ3XTD0_9ACTN|nr:diguanylate cyclase (GGDEF)-like protein/PAS domain S-box-containing protein [Actinoplanes couchii]GID61627.1 hypothetical protein Aco03nite_100310 [Actinoplanes couchii]